MLIEDDLDISEMDDLSEIHLENTEEVSPDDPGLLSKKHYFINEIVEDKLRRYIWTNCTDVAIRDSIMAHAPELIKQIIRKQNLHMIYPGQEESAFGDLVQTAWVQVERTLYKFRAKPHCRNCYNPDRPVSSSLYIPAESEYGIITFERLFDPKYCPPGSRKIIVCRKGGRPPRCPYCDAVLSATPEVEPKQGTFGGSTTILFRGNSKVFNMWCLTPETLLLSNNGVVELGEVVSSNRAAVAGSNGLTNVIAGLTKGVVDTLRIQTQYRYEIEGSFEHKLKKLGPSGPIWCEFKDLKVGDLVGIQLNQQIFGDDDDLSDIRLTKRGTWAPPKQLTEELAYIIGLFIAEGSYSYNQLRIYNTEREVINRLVGNNLGLNFLEHKAAQCIALDNARFIEFLRLLGFADNLNAETKCIPCRLLRCSRRIIRALLSGMSDGDGHSNRHNGSVGYTSTSKVLIRQLRMILLNFGILTKIQPDKRTKRFFTKSRFGRAYTSRLLPAEQLTCSTYYSNRFYQEIGFWVKRKQDKQFKLPSDKERLLGINDKFRELKQKYGCGTLGYDSLRRVLKASYCTIDTARAKIQSWASYQSDPDYQFIVDRLDEFDRPKNNIIWVPIVSITPSQSPVCEINVAADDSTYIANGFISHNSQVSRTVILAFVKKEGRDRKNSSAYKDYLCSSSRVDEDRLKRFFAEASQICKHNRDYMKCVEALAHVIEKDDKPYDGLIGKLVEYSGLSRVQVNSFIRMLRLRSHEFTDSPLSHENEHDRQLKKQFLCQDDE
jgi:intein/homing endonuclease